MQELEHSTSKTPSLHSMMLVEDKSFVLALYNMSKHLCGVFIEKKWCAIIVCTRPFTI